MRSRQIACCLLVLASPFLASAQSSDPWSDVTLYRDRWGTPHIYGDSFYGLGFGSGYSQARDHIGALHLAYRVAMGQAAAVWGEPFVESDRFALRMRHGELAVQYLQSGDEITRALCNGFAEGVNAWMADNPSLTPAWAERVTPAMPLALLHCYLMSFAPFDQPEVWRRSPGAITGNAFALAPAKTQSGRTILAVNPHADYNGPFQWCETHLIWGRMNIYGTTLIGLPVVLQGHNDRLGWALTPNQADFGDTYYVTRAVASIPANQLNVNRNTPDLSWANFVRLNTRMMQVRRDGGMENIAVDCLPAEQGPIMANVEGQMSAWRIGGYWNLGTMYQLMAMGAATTVKEFQSALALRQLPCFHIVYGDASGNILYLYNATVGYKNFSTPSNPMRPKLVPAEEWLFPLDGGNPATAWGPLISLNDMPWILNPDAGFVQACGNPPWRASDILQASAADWPAWLVRDPDTERAKRMRQLLGLGKRSFRDAQVLLFDPVAAAAETSVPKLLAAAKAENAPLSKLHPDTLNCIALLDGWAYTADTNSEAMTFFHAWWNALADLTRDDLRPGMTINQLIRRNDAQTAILLLQAASDAARKLRSQYQTINVPWGELHTLTRGNDRVPVAGTLSGDAILAMGDGTASNGTLPATYGYGFAMVVEFGDTPEAVSVLPFGTSDFPTSPHFDDQFELFTQGRYKRTRFTLDEVQRHAVEAQGRTLFLSAPGVTGRVVLYGQRPIEGHADALTTAPAVLPVGMAPFTLFLRPVIELNVPADVGLEFTVPEALCDTEDIPALAIYGYDDVRGWAPLEQQFADPATRSFSGSDTSPRLYAVLGPVGVRKTDSDDALIPDSTDASVAVPFQVAEVADERTIGDVGTFTPLSAPSIPQAPVPTAEGGPAQSGPPNPLNLPSQMVIGPDKLSLSSKDVPSAEDEAIIRGSTLADAAAAPPAEMEAIAATITPPSAPAAPESPAPTAPLSIALSGDVQAGNQVLLTAPDTTASLSLTSRMLIQGRLSVLAKPPAPLPEGLQVYGAIITAQYTPEPAPLYEVFPSITLPEGTVPAAHLPNLKLYGCDARNGWAEVKAQRVDTEKRTFSALDTKLRVYAVLGPPPSTAQ